MKFTWGHGITLVLIGFTALIATLVYGTFQQRVDLTSEDYYQQEVDYEGEKHAIENGMSLGTLVIDNSSLTNITFTLPEAQWSHVEVRLIRPDNADLDQVIEFETIEENNVEIDRPSEGRWNVEILATSGEELYKWELKEFF